MNLKDFIQESITAIVLGIKEANDAVTDQNAVVNPKNARPTKDGFAGAYGFLENEGSIKQTVHSIDFDVAVFASEDKETKGGIGISVASVVLGSQGKSGSSGGSESRIRFNVPVIYPSAPNPK
jgi:hypothetical protein